MHHPTILFIGAEDEENLAIRTLAAYVREHGIGARIAGFSREEDTAAVLRTAQRHRPDVIAVSLAFQCLAGLFFRLIERIREDGYRGHIVVGGHFPTFEYARILETQPGIDSVGRFEGEHSLVKLAQALADGTCLEAVPNLVYRDTGGLRENPVIHAFLDLDTLPNPVRERKPQLRLGERFATLISSRGCWHASCAYCCIGAFHRGKPEKFILRSADKVAEELAALYHRKGVRLFQFHDDNFVLPTREATFARIKALREAIGRRGVDPATLAFLIKARPDTVDEAVAAELARLGCVGVFLGIENATETGLQALIRRTAYEDLESAETALTAQGISVTYNLLVFHPHATMEEIAHNIAFVRERPGLAFDFGRAEIVAGSPLERLVINENRRCGEWPRWDYVMADPTVERLFDIVLRTFRARGSAYSQLMHALIALGYNAHTLCRLHQGPAAEALREAATALITGANLFVISCLERTVALAQGEATDAEITKLHADLQHGCGALVREAGEIREQIRLLQIAEHIFDRFHVAGELQRNDSLLRLFGCRAASEEASAR